jgi:hypothetical protein
MWKISFFEHEVRDAPAAKPTAATAAKHKIFFFIYSPPIIHKIKKKYLVSNVSVLLTRTLNR